MKQGDSVAIPVGLVEEVADMLRIVKCPSLADVLAGHLPAPKVTDLSAIDYLTQRYETWDQYEYTLREGLAKFSVEVIATWLRAANTNSLAAALILGENK